MPNIFSDIWHYIFPAFMPTATRQNCENIDSSYKRKRKLPFHTDFSSPRKMSRTSESTPKLLRTLRSQKPKTDFIDVSDDESDLHIIPFRNQQDNQQSRYNLRSTPDTNDKKVHKCLSSLKNITNRQSCYHPRLAKNSVVYSNENLQSNEYVQMINNYTRATFQKPKVTPLVHTPYDLRSRHHWAFVDLTVDDQSTTKHQSVDADVIEIEDDDDSEQVRRHKEIYDQMKVANKVVQRKRESQQKKDRLSQKIEENQWEIRQRHNHSLKIIQCDLENDLNQFLYICKKPYVEDDVFATSEDVVEVAVLPKISQSDRDVFENHLRSRNDNEMIIKKYNESVRRCDLKTLRSHAWLNDEVINFYLVLIQKRNEEKKLKSVHAMNTFFLTRYQTHSYTGVRRWTKNVDIFSKDFIIVPVHLGCHWCMITIDVNKKECLFYDSMLVQRCEYVELIRQYLIEEHNNKKNRPLDVSGWTFDQSFDIPEQRNSWDCGVFSCMFAEFVTRGLRLHKNIFTESDMEYFRVKMGVEIIKGSLIT